MHMIKGLGHLAFTCDDMEESLKFYCDGLGFTRAFELRRDDGSDWIVYLRFPGEYPQFLELFYRAAEADADCTSRVGYNHLCVIVEDMDRVVAALTQRGIALDKGPNLGKDNNLQCWIHDPDGNKIEVMQFGEDSIQMKSLRD